MKALKAGWLVISADNVRENTGFVFNDREIIEILSNAEIGRMEAAGLTEVTIDASREIVSPGFINTHMHQYGIMSHGMMPRKTITDFDSFLADYWWPDLENRLQKDDLLAAASVSAAELIHSGCVALCDILEAPFIEEDALIAQGNLLERIGMRAIVSLESSERVDRENGDRCLRMNRDAVRYFKQKSQLVRGAICTHTTFSCSQAFIRHAAEMAAAENALLQFHLSESAYEPERIWREQKQKPVHIYKAAGALGPSTLASQCVKIDAEEIELLAAHGVKASHMPISNCEVGGGIAPITAMLEHGITVGLGTDGYVNDFFELMRACFLIHKAAHERTDVMPARQVFRMATELGAHALGLTNSGTLQPNQVPDFIVIQDDYPTPVNLGNIYDQIVVYGKPALVRDVYVAGKAIMKDGEITSFDEAAAKHALCARTRQLWDKQ
jgi:cytosine/adenosine deaminase-related metal-dependent hydrolase